LGHLGFDSFAIPEVLAASLHQAAKALHNAEGLSFSDTALTLI
jgi:hypothetical protein